MKNEIVIKFFMDGGIKNGWGNPQIEKQFLRIKSHYFWRRFYFVLKFILFYS
jgi:hypothetical protein